LDIANIANMGIAPPSNIGYCQYYQYGYCPHPIFDIANIANIANMDVAPIQYPRLTDIRMTLVAVKPSLSHFQ